MVDPMGWLATREPPPPKELGAWLRIDPVEGKTMAGVLSAAAAEELGEALARPGRSREGAYHLLAADALMTYACEAAAEAPDLEMRLSAMLAALATTDGSSGPSGA